MESVGVGFTNPLGEETAPLRSWSETALCRDINLDLQALLILTLPLEVNYAIRGIASVNLPQIAM